MENSKKIHLGYFAAFVLSSIAAIAAATGDAQKYIHFTGVASEIGFFVFALALAGASLFMTFTKSNHK